jgi:hypothetical protein
MNHLFLDKDQVSAKKELDCYEYLLNEGLASFIEADFEKAAAYHENIVRTLKELARMKKEKEELNRAWLLFKQIDGERQQKELLYSLQVYIYE